MSKRFVVVAVLLIIAAGLLNYLISSTGILRTLERQSAKATPTSSQQLTQIECSKQSLSNVTEGPYYIENSPEKIDLLEEGVVGERLTLTGYVVDEECWPIPNAWLDFWQADGEGNYDNSGYRLRGHQYTDTQGKYSLTTVIPGEYPGRTPHIHVKVQATPTSPIITSQLFFPDSSINEGDFVYDKSLEVSYSQNNSVRTATYTFVVQK